MTLEQPAKDPLAKSELEKKVDDNSHLIELATKVIQSQGRSLEAITQQLSLIVEWMQEQKN